MGKRAQRDNWKGLSIRFICLFEGRPSELRDSRVCKSYTHGFSGAAVYCPWIKNVFLFWYFDIWGLTDPGETAHLRAGQFLDSKGPTWKHAFHMQANQSRATCLLPSSIRLLYSRPLFPLPWSPQSQVPDNSGQPLHPRACWDCSNYPILNLFTLPHPFLPAETTIKGPAHVFPLTHSVSWWALVLPLMALHGITLPLLLGTMNNKLSFWWQLSPDLLASPYVNNMKAYVLKHSLRQFF